MCEKKGCSNKNTYWCCGCRWTIGIANNDIAWDGYSPRIRAIEKKVK